MNKTSREYLHPYQRLVPVTDASTVIIRYRKASARPDFLHPSAHDSPMGRNAAHIDLSDTAFEGMDPGHVISCTLF
jgi:hypothetical protein